MSKKGLAGPQVQKLLGPAPQSVVPAPAGEGISLFGLSRETVELIIGTHIGNVRHAVG